MAELAHLSALTPRDRRLILGLSAVGLAPADLIAQAYFPSERSARARVQTLVQRGLIESLPVFARAVPGARSAHLLALSPAGMQVASALGGRTISRAQLEAGATLAESVAVVAQAYFSVAAEVVEAGGTWTLRPDEGTITKRGGVDAPEGAWAYLRASSNRMAVAFDIDLPGRSPEQVKERLTAWAKYREAGAKSLHVVYVIPDADRMVKVAKSVGAMEAIHYQEHPVEVARQLFKVHG